MASVLFTVAVWLLPAFNAIWLAAAGVALAMNVTGLPVKPAEVACNVLLFVPAVVPSVQLVTVAMPLESVVAFPPATEPPPAVTANVTATPATGLLNWSRTSTDGAMATAVFTVAVWLLPALSDIWLAAAGITVTGAVWVIATPLTVAETVFPSATVELTVPVATPATFVAPGWTIMLPVPVAASTTVAPPIGLPN
jgi:hypothetical protein